MSDHEYYMNLAMEEGKKAFQIAEVPIGSIIVYQDEIIARAYNQKEINNNSTHHAEILAINQASEYLKRWRLTDCTMYVTVEPCPMCAGAIIQSRISNLIFGTENKKYGSFGSVLALQNYYPDAKNLTIQSGILQSEISLLMKDFFRKELPKIK